MSSWQLCLIGLVIAITSACGGDDCDPKADKAYCEDGVAHRCMLKVDQWEWDEATCQGSPAPHCIVTDPSTSHAPNTFAFCALASQPDPRCDGSADPYFCEGADLFQCTDGYVVLQHPCSGSGAACCT